MPGKIFISYRRDDSAEQVHGIAQYLERVIGRNQVFVDVDMIPGTHFPRELENRLGECTVLLALIGPGWLGAADDNGARRLDDPADWVRLEIARALRRSVTVIPVLLGGAKLPPRAELPDDIEGLLDHQAARVGIETFRNDIAGLAADIAALRGSTSQRRWTGAIAAVVAAILLAAGVSYGASVLGWFGPRVSASRSSQEPTTAAFDIQPTSAADVLAGCIKDQRHPDRDDIIANLVRQFGAQKFRYGWIGESTPTQRSSVVVWHDITDATASDGALQLRIPWRNGRLRLVPVVKRQFSTRGIANVSLVLQGMWSQDNGYGCMDLTFNDKGEARGAIGVMNSSRLDTQAFIERVYGRAN